MKIIVKIKKIQKNKSIDESGNKIKMKVKVQINKSEISRFSQKL